MEPVIVNQDVRGEIAAHGYAWVPRASWAFTPAMEQHWHMIASDWDSLEPDRFLKDGATFRRRRYGRYYWSPAEDRFLALPNQAYFQPEHENAYAGGIPREFAPLLPATVDSPFPGALMRCCFAQLPLDSERRRHNWEVRVHQIRVVATCAQPGEPSPEGIHQDGTDFLTLHLVRRHNIAGGETTIYDLARNPLHSYTLREPMDSFIMQDPRIMHGVTKVYPANNSSEGIRDLLGLDFIYNPELRPAE